MEQKFVVESNVATGRETAQKVLENFLYNRGEFASVEDEQKAAKQLMDIITADTFGFISVTFEADEQTITITPDGIS